MELDDLKTAWTAHGQLLERSLAINERLLREVMLRKARGRLLPHLVWRGIEVALGVAVLLAVITVLAAHGAEPRYVVVVGILAIVVAGTTALSADALGVAVLLAVITVLAAHGAEPRYVVVVGILAIVVAGTTALSAYALVTALQLDYGGPVTGLQRGVEQVRRAEYQALKWAVLGGVVAWLPAALVLFEAVTGFALLARVDLGWVVANLGFGLIVVVVGQAMSRKYLEQPDLAPWARRVMDAVSGRSVRAAAGHLAELARWQRDQT